MNNRVQEVIQAVAIEQAKSDAVANPENSRVRKAQLLLKRKPATEVRSFARNWNWVVVQFLLHVCCGALNVLRLLPTKYVLWCTSSIGGIAARFCAKDTAIIDAQLRHAFPNGVTSDFALNDSVDSQPIAVNSAGQAPLAPSRSPKRMQGLDRKIFQHVGECVGECILWERFLQQRDHRCRREERDPAIIDSGGELLEQLAASTTGAIGLSAHLGSFELLAAYLAHRGLKCSVIGRAPNYPLLEEFVRSLREGYGVEVIWSNSGSAPRDMINAIRSGRIICALIDQDTRWTSAFSPFFGLDASYPVAPIQLALRYNLPIFTSFIVRVAPMKHQVISQYIDYDRDDPDALDKILKVYTQRLESWICRYPDQYIWWHRRWRRRPGVDYSATPQQLRSSSQYRTWLSEVVEKRMQEG